MRIKNKRKKNAQSFVSIFATGSIIELPNGEKLYMDHNFISRRHQMTILPSLGYNKISATVFIHATRRGRCRFFSALLSSRRTFCLAVALDLFRQINKTQACTEQCHCKSFSNHKDDIYSTN